MTRARLDRAIRIELAREGNLHLWACHVLGKHKRAVRKDSLTELNRARRRSQCK